jgi:hypothetical protein
MTRRFRTAILTAGLITAASTVAMANRPVTYILTNGERISGELTYKGGREFSLIVNGRTIDFEPEQIAAFAFVPGDPPTSELQQLPSSGHAELERDMIVMRDGRIIRMKLYSISDDGETIRYDTSESGQVVRDKRVPSGDVARMYVLGTNARQAFASRLGSSSQAVATSGNASAGAVQVPANQQWTDTGLSVRRGERVAFYANGQVNLSADGNPAFTSNASGNPAMTMPRGNLPVKTLPWGALIGRIGAGQPFAIGGNGGAITMSAAGRLYLGVNDAAFDDNSGAFSVTVVR